MDFGEPRTGPLVQFEKVRFRFSSPLNHEPDQVFRTPDMLTLMATNVVVATHSTVLTLAQGEGPQCCRSVAAGKVQ